MLADLNGPGTYLTWSVFTISVANLIVVAAMLVLFFLALVVPFPRGKVIASGPEESGAPGDVRDADLGWTGRLREAWLRHLPPRKLMPDTQPAYVASWVYVFGVGTLAALAVVVLSGVVLAIGGVDWWHTHAIGHFFNSLHLWSVELFMAFMVIHLWAKFWMAAWRGKRARTWITGVIAFFASIVEAFTGYLSQQNFDSQWIATNGKDAFNAVGLGAFFNLTDFGQMLLWHVVLLPIVLVAVVGGHVLLVRAHGVVPPLAVNASVGKGQGFRARHRARSGADAAEWTGPRRRYDIVKEGTWAAAITLAAALVLASIFSSPDEPPVTIQAWAQAQPADFVGTAANELGGTSDTAAYGPPYGSSTDNTQSVVVNWQTLAGERIPIDPPHAFVLDPLSAFAPVNAPLQQALNTWNTASSDQQQSWVTAYLAALPNAKVGTATVDVPGNGFGPVPVLMATELTLAQSGSLDSKLVQGGGFYGTDYTRPLLFLEDGTYYASVAESQHLLGEQWGVTNETGSYPGQPWLWLYQLWYQIGPIQNSSSVDVWAVDLTVLATLLLVLVPFLPGVRRIPELIPVHRLIWRHREQWDSGGNHEIVGEAGVTGTPREKPAARGRGVG